MRVTIAQPFRSLFYAPLSVALHGGHFAAEGLEVQAITADGGIVNLIDRMLEVHRTPIGDAAAAFGWRFGLVEVLGPEAVLSPLARPDARIPVGDLLP